MCVWSELKAKLTAHAMPILLIESTDAPLSLSLSLSLFPSLDAASHAPHTPSPSTSFIEIASIFVSHSLYSSLSSSSPSVEKSEKEADGKE